MRGFIDSLPLDASVKGIIFDYGGTLDSRGDHWSYVILDAYREVGVRLSIEEFKDAYIHGERELAKPGMVAPTDNFLDLMRKKISLQLDFAGLGDDIAAKEAIAQYCYDRARMCVEELRPQLQELAGRYPMALVTNFYGNIRSVLADFGIDLCFKAVIESRTVGVSKPDPAIFRLGLDALGLEADEVLVVGDSYGKDILPARSIGCWTYQIEGRQWPPQEY